MTFEEKREVLFGQLKDNLDFLQSSREVLEYSYRKCKQIDLMGEHSFNDLESFEALTARFARTSDIFTQKVLKTLFMIIQDIPKTFIDGANLLEKIEIIKSAEELLDIRQLRNEIAHEYTARDINSLFQDVLKKVPKVLGIIDDVQKYIEDSNFI